MGCPVEPEVRARSFYCCRPGPFISKELHSASLAPTKIRVYQTCNSLKLRYLRNRDPRSDPNYTVSLRHAGTAHGP
jgi:hypothetical protein